MAMEYFCCYHSYEKKLAKLSDQEVGRLFRALLSYSARGETPELAGRESVAFDFISDDIDRAKENYAETCKRNAENGKRGGRPRTNEKSAWLSENRPVFEKTQKSQNKSENKTENESLSSSDAHAREDDDQREQEILKICGEAIGGIDAAERDMLLTACEGLDMEEIRKAAGVAKGYRARTAKYLAQAIRSQHEKPGRKPKAETGQTGKILTGGMRPVPKIPEPTGKG